MKVLFERIVNWQDSTFTEASALSKWHHLEEEINELKEMLEEPFPERTKLGYEIADALMLIFWILNKEGFNYFDMVYFLGKKMDINESREWSEPDENGVCHHIKKEIDE